MPRMRRPSCFLQEGRTEVVRGEQAVSVDDSSYKSEWDEKSSGSPVRCAQTIAASDRAEGAGRDKYKQMKMAPPMGRAGMDQEPGHTWVGSALTGKRFQEPALLGCQCMKPIGLGNCPVSVGRPSSCMPHAIGSGFRPYCWRRGQGRHCGVQ